MAIERSFVHKWAKDGSHLSFNDVHEMQDLIFRTFNYRLNEKTAYRIRQHEMSNYEQKNCKKAHLKRPNISAMINEYLRSKQTLSKLIEEPSFVSTELGGRPYTFLPSWYPDLEEVLEANKSIPGFGTLFVQVAAADLYKEKTSSLLGSFVPSTAWCRWFLRRAGYVVRRRSKYKATLKEIEAQDKLHEYNLQRLAYLKREKNLRDDMIVAGDETNTYFFPGENEIWERKGGAAESCLKEDKRNYTNNIWNNANGELLFHHQIFFGKTEASLPSAEIRDQYPHFMFSTSKNHWCNQDLKLKEVIKATSMQFKFTLDTYLCYVVQLIHYLHTHKFSFCSWQGCTIGKYSDIKKQVLMKNRR